MQQAVFSCLLATVSGQEKLQNAAATTEARPCTTPVSAPATTTRRDLRRRSTSVEPGFTIGYQKGNPASALTCPPSWTAPISSSPSPPAFGCCNTNDECNAFYNTCIDYGQQLDCAVGDNLSACSPIYGSILSCSSYDSLCIRFVLSTATDGTAVATSYGCLHYSTVIPVLAVTTSALTSSETSQSTTAGISRATESTISLETSSTASSPGTSASSSDGNSTSHTTTIVIPAVIVPVVVICIIAAAYWMWRRKHKHGLKSQDTTSIEMPQRKQLKRQPLHQPGHAFTGIQAQDDSRQHNGNINRNGDITVFGNYYEK